MAQSCQQTICQQSLPTPVLLLRSTVPRLHGWTKPAWPSSRLTVRGFAMHKTTRLAQQSSWRWSISQAAQGLLSTCIHWLIQVSQLHVLAQRQDAHCGSAQCEPDCACGSAGGHMWCCGLGQVILACCRYTARLVFTAVQYPISCSSCLAVLDQIGVTSGSVAKRGSIAYVSQEVWSCHAFIAHWSCCAHTVHAQAWIQNASLKNNILFGEQFVQSRYDEV
jgi:hypothetical protein